jgi:hypothetical protein
VCSIRLQTTKSQNELSVGDIAEGIKKCIDTHSLRGGSEVMQEVKATLKEAAALLKPVSEPPVNRHTRAHRARL